MDFPSTSQSMVKVNFDNLCKNGAKMFTDSEDRSRFITEFSHLIEQNPNWSAIRLIRERLKIQMQIMDTKKQIISNGMLF